MPPQATSTSVVVAFCAALATRLTGAVLSSVFTQVGVAIGALVSNTMDAEFSHLTPSGSPALGAMLKFT